MAVGLAVGALCLYTGWRYYQQHVLGRDVGPTLPPMFMVGPEILTLLALSFSYSLFRQWIGVSDVDPTFSLPLPLPLPLSDSDCEPDIVFGGLGVTVGCAWAGLRGFRHYRQAAGTPLSAIADLLDGPVRVAGRRPRRTTSTR